MGKDWSPGGGIGAARFVRRKATGSKLTGLGETTPGRTGPSLPRGEEDFLQEEESRIYRRIVLPVNSFTFSPQLPRRLFGLGNGATY